MMIAVIGPSLVLAALIAYEIFKNTNKERKASEEFWAKETEANSARKKDISKLDYIKVPVDALPLGLCPAFDEVTANEETIKELSKEQIFSLKGMSNTDVKLTYGVANFEFLCECDERYSRLLQALSKEAELLSSLSFDREAEQVLNYAFSIGTDLPKDYIRLAEIYRDRRDRNALNDLMDKAELLDSPTKASLIEKLEEIEDSF